MLECDVTACDALLPTARLSRILDPTPWGTSSNLRSIGRASISEILFCSFLRGEGEGYSGCEGHGRRRVA